MSRIGQNWTPEEDTILHQEITEHKNYKEISLNHNRTILGCKLRVLRLFVYPYSKIGNINLDELSSLYDIEKDLIHTYIQYYDKRKDWNTKKFVPMDNLLNIIKLCDNKISMIDEKVYLK